MTNVTKISDNEYSVDSETEVSARIDGSHFTIPPGGSLYFRDKGSYVVDLFATEGFEGGRSIIDIDNKSAVTNDVPGRVIVTKEAELARRKEALTSDLDTLVEKHRSKFITFGYGQMLVYIRKEQEATLYLQDQDVDQSRIPYLTKEATVRDISLQDMAELIISTRNVWAEADSTLEAARILAKTKIDQIEDVPTIMEVEIHEFSGIPPIE